MKIKLEFKNKKDAENFWDGCQELFDKCNVTLTPDVEFEKIIEENSEPWEME